MLIRDGLIQVNLYIQPLRLAVLDKWNKNIYKVISLKKILFVAWVQCMGVMGVFILVYPPYAISNVLSLLHM